MGKCSKGRCQVGNMAKVANLYYSTDRFSQCEEQCKKTLEIEPDCTWVRNTLGLVYLQTERCPEAIELARGVIADDPWDHSAYYVLAAAYEFQEQYAKAEQICKDGLSLRPDSLNIWCTLARIYTKAGNAEAGLETAKEMLARYPDDPYTLYCAFLVVNKFESGTETEADLIGMLQRTGQKRELLYYCQGLFAEKRGKLDEAYKMYACARAENMLELELRKYVTAFEKKYPEVVRRAGL